MTPREVHAWVELANERRRRELAENLTVAALGARGSENDIKERLREWSDE